MGGERCILYRLCRRYPDHRDAKGVTAKMLVIGRVYAAAAERGRSAGSAAESSGDEFYVRDLPRAIRTSGLYAKICALRRFRSTTDQNVQQVLLAHSELMVVLRDLTGLEKRALASKYLHFHLPKLFFIFDSRAQCMIRSLSTVPRRNSILRVSGGDSEYARFVVRSLALRAELENRFGVRLTQDSSIGSCFHLRRASGVTPNIDLQPTAAGAILSHRG